MESGNQIDIIDILSIIVPSIVTVLGFFISNRISKKEFNQHIQEIKFEKQLANMYELPKDVFTFIDMIGMLYVPPHKAPEGFDELKDKIYTTVICSGSEDAMKIMVHIRETLSAGIDDGIEIPASRLIAGYVLLAMQIKYDVTGIENSPLTWYSGRFTSQKMLEAGPFYEASIIDINNIVNQLNLKSFLRIDET